MKLKTFAGGITEQVNSIVAESNGALQGTLVTEMSNQIKRERVELMKKGIAKEQSLLGQYHKANNEKPANKPTFKKDGEIITPESFSKEQIEALAKATKTVETLRDAMIDCATDRKFIAPEGTAEEIESAQAKYVKEDVQRFKKLESLVNKK